METEIDQTFQLDHITEEQILKTTEQFLGEIDQFPPIFSAVKQDGKRLYELARKGQKPEVKSRKISISEFAITGVELPEVHFKVRCSKGTYIRSLAHDFGKALNNGGYLSALRRTKIGQFDVANAQSIEAFEASLSGL